MYLVHSEAEKSALQAVTNLGAQLAENPDDTALRVAYKHQQRMLRDHARAGVLIYRATTMPTPLHVALDTRGLAAFLSGAQQ